MLSISRSAVAPLMFVCLVGGILIIDIGGSFDAPPVVAVFGVVMIMLGLLVPFLRLPRRPAAEETARSGAESHRTNLLTRRAVLPRVATVVPLLTTEIQGRFPQVEATEWVKGDCESWQSITTRTNGHYMLIHTRGEDEFMLPDDVVRDNLRLLRHIRAGASGDPIEIDAHSGGDEEAPGEGTKIITDLVYFDDGPYLVLEPERPEDESEIIKLLPPEAAAILKAADRRSGASGD